MFVLASTSDKVQVVTSAAGSVKAHASWTETDTPITTSSNFKPDRNNPAAITTATTTDLIASPASAKVRNARYISIRNDHASVSNTVTLQHTDGTNVTPLPKVTLLAGEFLIMDERGVIFVYDANGIVKMGYTGVDPKTNDFRLSGVTATPVMTADSTTLSTIFLCQYRGNRIALYDGTNWQLCTPPSEVSLAVSGRTTDLPFDVFAFSNAGTVTLEFLNWTSSSARATGLTRQDGVWTKTGDATRRYLGSVRARSATTFHWVLGGIDLPAKFDLFNADNRVDFAGSVKASTDTWTYTTATIRQAQASANYQADIMAGLQEELAIVDLIVTSQNSTISIEREVGIGFDSTTVFSGLVGTTTNEVASQFATGVARLVNQPAIGSHKYCWLEISTATGTCTFLGDNAGTRVQSGMTIQWTC